jgi:hypothetical protein
LPLEDLVEFSAKSLAGNLDPSTWSEKGFWSFIVEFKRLVSVGPGLSVLDRNVTE